MFRKALFRLMPFLLVTSILVLAFKIGPVRAEGTIYINADGSIAPSTAPISTFDNITYTFTGNVNESIVVQRSNIVIDGAGYTVQGPGAGTGIDFESVSNVTMKNVSITAFNYGIWLGYSSNNTLSSNKANGNTDDGISLHSSSNNTLSGNVAAGNSGYGIALISSSNNTLSKNNATDNNGLGGAGVYLESSSNNTLSGNIETGSYYGIVFGSSSDNNLSQNVIDNNFLNFLVYGSVLDDFVNWVDASNFVNGKPVYYFVNQNGLVIDSATHASVGYLALVNCTSITVENLTLTNKNKEGPLLAYTTDSTITHNNIATNQYGIHLRSSSNNTVSDNNVTRNPEEGIYLDSASNNMVSHNNVTGNGGGIHLDSSFGNTVSGNNVTGNPGGIGLLGSCNDTLFGNTVAGSTSWGIGLGDSSNNTISGNNVTGNSYQGISLFASFNDTVSGNNVTGNFGDGIYAYYCSNDTVSGNNVTRNYYGIWFDDSSFNTILDNIVTANSGNGIALGSSSYNRVLGNTAIGNGVGIFLDNSSSNAIYHNNFMNNTQQASLSNSQPNAWDNSYPSGGNYWGDYADVDERSGLSQDQNGNDGIGDSPYVIDANNTDHYPLMGPITSFTAGTWNGTAYNVDIVSNSTVSSVQVDIANRTVSFNATGPESTHGFCRVTIPNVIVQDLWHGNYTVLIDNEQWPFANWTDTSNTYVYINYTHSEHEVVIIPELPSTMTLWLLTALTTVAVALAKRRTPRKLKT